MEPSNNDNKYYKAKKQVREIKKFYTTLMMYLIFISGLAMLNYYTNEFRYPWFLWAAFGWGIGLFFQGVKAFQWNPFYGKDWEERKIKEFMDKDSDDENTIKF
ncbi:2TM domain-containing protein [Ulvibacter litoralis]|uniref:2TM domain-containing protein n=1 Tax=Ulvibacter litoralis TaxID=227084 RepID=A0A1G7EZW8_9FLAO|nr:2TM domain-containing protein [Ulvibacter litoralis]GHC53263.1 histidine kinase [Ulvibacter litoralis]SDE69223.1 2TM domain-containing protein [Ulvibacter litoralis]